MSTDATWRVLLVYLAVLAVQRIGELVLSHRNVARLLARGGREAGARHFPLFVLLHVAYPVLLVWEVRVGAVPGGAWPAWLALWLLAQPLRLASVRALGERWTARIVVLPGEVPVSQGIYRWMRHPNYVAVVLEFIAAPMLFGAWRTALVCSLANALLLRVRIPAEERALREAAGR